MDSKQVHNEILEYLKGIAPELIDRVKLYEDQTPLFDKANIEQELRDLFKRRCDLPSGGYLIIEPTEALVSVDVNSGRYTGKKDPEKTILKTNLEAAREVARQMRLARPGRHHRLRLHRHGDEVEPRQGAPGAAHAPRPRPRAHEGVRRERPRPDRDDAPARAPEPPPEHDRGRVRPVTAPAACSPPKRSPVASSARCVASASRARRTRSSCDVHPDVAMYVLENEKDLLEEAREGGGVRTGVPRRSAAEAGRVQAGGEVGGEGCDAAVRSRVKTARAH